MQDKSNELEVGFFYNNLVRRDKSTRVWIVFYFFQITKSG